MKCKLSKELSEMVPFVNDTDHKYLRAVFVPTGMSMIESLSLGTNAQYRMNIYPGRDNEGKINEEQYKALVSLFESGDMFKDEYNVDRIKVPVEPFLMKRSRDSQFGKKGEIIMDGVKPRVYDYINIVTFMKDDNTPAIDENQLKTRALAIKNFRVKNNDYVDYAVYLSQNGKIADEEPNDSTTVEEDAKMQAEAMTKAKEAEEKRKQLEAELAALNAPEKF